MTNLADMDILKDLLFVFAVYFITSIPCFVVVGIVYFLLKKLAPGARMACVIFTGVFGLLLFPTMMPGASIMQVPGPAAYMLFDTLILGDKTYLIRHISTYPIFTLSSFVLTLAIGFFISTKLFGKNQTTREPETGNE